MVFVLNNCSFWQSERPPMSSKLPSQKKTKKNHPPSPPPKKKKKTLKNFKQKKIIIKLKLQTKKTPNHPTTTRHLHPPLRQHRQAPHPMLRVSALRRLGERLGDFEESLGLAVEDRPRGEVRKERWFFCGCLVFFCGCLVVFLCGCVMVLCFFLEC